MLLPNVQRIGNGGYRLPGEAVYHIESDCSTVRWHRQSLDYVQDVTLIELCPECRRIVQGEA